MLLVSQRDVDKYGSQPVGITLYFYVVGFRVTVNTVCISTSKLWTKTVYLAVDASPAHHEHCDYSEHG